MKSGTIVLCWIVLCIGCIQAVSIVPEGRVAPPPQLWEGGESSEEVVTAGPESGVSTAAPVEEESEEAEESTEGPGDSDLTTVDPEVDGESSEGDGGEETTTVGNKPQYARLVQVCTEMFMNGEIQIPDSMSTMNAASSSTAQPNTSSTTTTTTTTMTDSADSQTTEAGDDNTMTTVTTVTTTMATGPAILFSCNFEHGWCSIEQDTVLDQFNWTLGEGATPSDLTGPDAAFSGKHYIYIEASGHEQGEGAEITLPALTMASTMGDKVCLQFKYHMFGHHIQHLKTYLQRPLGVGNMNNRWQLGSLSGQQGKQWHQAQINFYASRGDRIGFLGTRGGGYSGDIALDDIVVSSGFCSNDITESPETAESHRTTESPETAESHHRTTESPETNNNNNNNNNNLAMNSTLNNEVQ